MTDQNEQGKDDGRRGDDYSNIRVTNSSGTAIGPGSRAAVNVKNEQATAEPKEQFRCTMLESDQEIGSTRKGDNVARNEIRHAYQLGGGNSKDTNND